MLQIATKAEIDHRVNGVNQTAKWLARKAEVDPMTVYRGAKRVKQVQAMTVALETEELRVADHLLTLPHVRDHLMAALGLLDRQGEAA